MLLCRGGTPGGVVASGLPPKPPLLPSLAEALALLAPIPDIASATKGRSFPTPIEKGVGCRVLGLGDGFRIWP